MKKFLSIVLGVVLAMGVAVISFAEEPKETTGPAMGKEMMKGEKMMGCEGMMAKGKMGHEKMMMGCCSMHGMMMKSMMEKKIVATSDGGVVVAIGNKLFKYDKNLELKKETEIKVDSEAMKKMMMEMKEKCPMCKKMMGGCGMMKEGAEGEPQEASVPVETSKPVETSEHEAHHP
jgi:hypothetical protein